MDFHDRSYYGKSEQVKGLEGAAKLKMERYVFTAWRPPAQLSTASA